jgi:hypothetical protein
MMVLELLPSTALCQSTAQLAKIDRKPEMLEYILGIITILAKVIGNDYHRQLTLGKFKHGMKYSFFLRQKYKFFP